MKKKIVALLGAAALALALPMSAFAVSSPSGTTAIASNGAALTVSGDYTGNLNVAVSTANAEGVPAGSNVVASFEVTADAGTVINGQLTFVFNVGAQYAGATATVYIQHGDGTTESQVVTIAADGTFTLAVSKLSIFSVVVDESTIPASNQGVVDTSAKSPQTGADLNVVAFGTVAALVAAAGVAVALRKKVTE